MDGDGLSDYCSSFCCHSKSLEDLLAQQKEHGIITDRPSSSQLFKDLADNSGAVLAQFYSMAKSTCWGISVTQMYRVYQSLIQLHTDSFVGYFSDSDVQSIPEFDSTSSDGSTVYRSPSPHVESFEEAESIEPIAHLALGPTISGVAQEEQSYFVESPESPPPTFQLQDTSASSSDSPMHFNSDDILLDDTADVQPTFLAVTVDLSPLIDDFKISLSKHMDNAQSDILSRLHTVERGLRDTLGQQNEFFRNLIQSAHQYGQNQDDIQTLRFNAFKKVVLAQGVTAGANSVEVRKEIKALDDKINSLDGQVGAIRNEQLEFQTKIAADILSLSTQLGDLVDYIRGGDAKKGEGSSSRHPLPPPVNQGEGSGNKTSGDTVRTTEIAQRDIDNAQRDILERLMAADRQRERERGSRSSSGSHKRRRY
ncbi:nuclear matrix constituent protein 1-like protein-like [Dorcoceras hygrometricum]|uniref:Nuclear matrix constituent protein 1-like protein-like n=1 Tax=Dorcoceras hygrometricum TaxID=472368 RepID=A0A2Z7BZH1_9LAMI|nr:nuclear matrix constituent protein 1-like protein-like [Dorcoceras hygrometricum]